MTTTLRSLLSFVPLLLLTHIHWAGAQSLREEHDVPYVAGGSKAQSLDLFLPTATGFPTIVFFHGGSLASGDKADPPTAQICANLVAKGIGCISANYRFGPDVIWPTHGNDAAAAVAWAVRNLRSRGADTSRIYLMGHSSGCMLVSLLGSDPKYLATQHLTPAAIRGVLAMGCLLGPVFDTAGMAPSRVANYFAPGGPLHVFGSIDLLTDAAAIGHISRNLPPFLVLIAEGEKVSPPILASANAFVAKATSIGVTPLPQIRVLTGRLHYTALNEMANPDDPTLQLVVRFIRTGAP